jgi:hypothetical protein
MGSSYYYHFKGKYMKYLNLHSGNQYLWRFKQKSSLKGGHHSSIRWDIVTPKANYFQFKITFSAKNFQTILDYVVTSTSGRNFEITSNFFRKCEASIDVTQHHGYHIQTFFRCDLIFQIFIKMPLIIVSHMNAN